MAKRRLGGGEAGNGDPRRATRDVVDPDGFEEVDGIGVAPVLAADPDHEPGIDLSPGVDGGFDQLADTAAIDRRERVAPTGGWYAPKYGRWRQW